MTFKRTFIRLAAQLKSQSCAPCKYMVEAVKRVAPHFEGVVEWREHAIKKMDALTFMSL